MRSILNDPEVMALGEGLRGRHVYHQPTDVHRNEACHAESPKAGERSGAHGCDLPFGVGVIDVESDWLAIHKDRDGVEVADDFGRRGKRHRRHEDGLSPLNAKGFEGQVKRRGR